MSNWQSIGCTYSNQTSSVFLIKLFLKKFKGGDPAARSRTATLFIEWQLDFFISTKISVKPMILHL
jgi:hypothetical protein